MIATIVLAATIQFMYSPDGITSGSGLRSLPSQGVSRTTGNTIVGLHGLSDIQRADCGWYRYAPVAKPDTNHYWRVTNYVFHATGIVQNVWSEYSPKPRAKNYCKADIIAKLSRMGFGETNKWQILKGAIEEAQMMDLWNAATYIPADEPAFIKAKPLVMDVLGMTEKELDDFLELCIY